MKNRTLIFAFFVFAVIALAVIGSLFRARTDQAKKLEIQGRELAQFSAEKDSISQTLADATQSISNVYNQVANVAGAVAITRTLENIDNVNYKSEVASKLVGISDMVGNYKLQMKTAESRLATLKQKNAGFAEKVVILEQTVKRLQATIEQQEQRIAQLGDELNITRAERDRFRAEAMSKARSLVEREKQLTETREELNTAYFIIGKTDDLSKQGYIEKKGSVLIFGGAWKPSDSLRVDSNFTQINVAKTLELPMKSKFYRIVSAHDQRLLRPQPNESEVTPYMLKIAKPEKFWAQSKVLIIVED
jgi:septal ring factor EnvC (AmiA/AmiB activator)